MTSLLQLRAKSRDERIKVDRTGKVWSDNVLNSYIQQAYLKLQQDAKFSIRECDWYTQLTITNWLSPLPSDFMILDDICYNWVSLNRIEKKDLLSMTDTPSMYYIFWNNFWFNSATWIVDLYYRKKLPTLSASQDTVVSEDYDDAIVTYVKYLCFMSVGKEQEAMMHLQDYERLKASLLSTYLLYDTNIRWN